jgi:RNA-directed DNA polymerase
MSTVEEQIATRSREHPGEALTNLHSYIDEEMLHQSFASLNKKGASGVDGEAWIDYDKQKGERIPQLLTDFKKGSYRAPAIRRVYIPKGDGKMRPLGLPTVEDKLLQTAVSHVLSPIYEQLFYENSYGFRPGKSQHQALEKLFQEVSFNGMHYVIDADMKNYFGSINHQHLRAFLDLRIKDGVIRRQIDKWLKAGILEEGQLTYPKEGTPQGGSISPLISNIYLHYVLDQWFTEQIQPLLKGKSCLIRYADDFLMCFTRKEDAGRVMEVLPKRLGKYDLTLHPEKTKLIDLNSRSKDERSSFDFLGFTHYMGKSQKGKTILKRKTSSKKLTLALKRTSDWLKNNRHQPVQKLVFELNLKLRGHYSYYGVTFNSHGVRSFYEQVKRLLFKWLNRRGGKRKWNWEHFTQLILVWIPLERPKIFHSFVLAKP